MIHSCQHLRIITHQLLKHKKELWMMTAERFHVSDREHYDRNDMHKKTCTWIQVRARMPRRWRCVCFSPFFFVPSDRQWGTILHLQSFNASWAQGITTRHWEPDTLPSPITAWSKRPIHKRNAALGEPHQALPCPHWRWTLLDIVSDLRSYEYSWPISQLLKAHGFLTLDCRHGGSMDLQ